MYVAVVEEHLRDGIEQGAMVFASVKEALEWLQKCKEGFGGCNSTFALFEVGKRIELGIEKTEEPQPAKVIERLVIKGS